MNFSILGLGYVGGAMQTVLQTRHFVSSYDIDRFKKPSCATLEEAIAKADTFLLCLPTDFSEAKKGFDTSILDETIEKICQVKPCASIIIKSTVPLGYCDAIQDKYPKAKVFFSPEFLRESKAEEDAFRPSRLIIGCRKENEEEGKRIGDAIRECLKEDAPFLLQSLQEAEAVKLFSNAYLAMRIAFFNELDNYAMENHLNAKSIIEGVGYDPRIGSIYCNPSFGFGGYCLPKDTKQLQSNYRPIPERLISAVIESNVTRKQIIGEEILRRVSQIQNPTILIYHLRMEKGSSSYRYSCMEDLILLLKDHANILIYEPYYPGDSFQGCPVISHAEEALKQADLIVSNRMEEELVPYEEKLFTRDIQSVSKEATRLPR